MKRRIEACHLRQPRMQRGYGFDRSDLIRQMLRRERDQPAQRRHHLRSHQARSVVPRPAVHHAVPHHLQIQVPAAQPVEQRFERRRVSGRADPLQLSGGDGSLRPLRIDGVFDAGGAAVDR